MPVPAPVEASGGKRSLLAALSPSPAAERRPKPSSSPPPAGIPERRAGFPVEIDDEQTTVDRDWTEQSVPAPGAVAAPAAPASSGPSGPSAKHPTLMPPPRRKSSSTAPPPVPKHAPSTVEGSPSNPGLGVPAPPILPPPAAPTPGAATGVGDGFDPLPTPVQRELEQFAPPPTRILRGEQLGDRPFAPPTVIPIPEVPEPGLYSAAKYSVTFVRANWQRRGAIKGLAEDIKRDTDALDTILGSLGRAARAANLQGRTFASENAAISSAEARREQLERDGTDLQSRRNDETTKYVDVESGRTKAVTEAELALAEAQRELQHLEGQRRGLRDRRKEVERRQRGLLKAAEDRDEQAINAPMGMERTRAKEDALSHRREASDLDPERQDIDRKLGALERPIADQTAKVDAAKGELEAARRSLDDAREGHGHRLAELEAEQKRKAKEIAQTEAEILRRLVTLGTLVNLNRVDQPEFTDLYQRIDRLRTAITARTTEIDKLTAERAAYDRSALYRGIATIAVTLVALIGLIVLLRACV